MVKQEVIQSIEKNKIIAIMRNVPRESVVAAATALYEGGIRLVEVTFNQKKGSDDTIWAIKELIKEFSGRMMVGAGTVMTLEQTEQVADAGGLYIISPNVNLDVIRRTGELGMVSMPGAFTPSEIVTAYEGGADFIKLFPAGELGVSYIKAIRAPINHIPLLAVGGVDEKNLKDFLSAGIQGVGIASNIVDNRLIETGDFAGLTKLAKAYTDQIEA